MISFFGSPSWSPGKLQDLVLLQRGFDITKAEQKDGEIHVISSSGPGSRHNVPKVQGPGVIIGRKGTLGSVFYSEEDYWPHDTTLWSKDLNGNNPRFVYYALQRIDMSLFDTGAANPTLNRNHIHGLPIFIPERRIQDRIASVLAVYDDLIENNRRRIALLEDAARQLYKEWFVRFRFPGHEHVKVINGLPDGWERLPLSSICSRITDGSHASPKAVDDGFPMASVKDMEDWRLDLSSCRQISHDDYESLVRYDCKPLKGDVLIAKDGSYLKHCFVVQDDIDVVILSSIAILRPNERIDPFILAFTLKDPKIKEMMAGYVSGVALPRIILREFRGFEIVVPDRRIQAAWGELVHPLCYQAQVLLKQNDALARARDLLLPKLMNGTLTV